MSNGVRFSRIPSSIGKEPLVGSFYPVECIVCGWVGSSEVLTDDCECTQDAGGRLCLGDADEIGVDRLLYIVQALSAENDRLNGVKDDE